MFNSPLPYGAPPPGVEIWFPVWITVGYVMRSTRLDVQRDASNHCIGYDRPSLRRCENGAAIGLAKQDCFLSDSTEVL